MVWGRRVGSNKCTHPYLKASYIRVTPMHSSHPSHRHTWQLITAKMLVLAFCSIISYTHTYRHTYIYQRTTKATWTSPRRRSLYLLEPPQHRTARQNSNSLRFVQGSPGPGPKGIQQSFLAISSIKSKRIDSVSGKYFFRLFESA